MEGIAQAASHFRDGSLFNDAGSTIGQVNFEFDGFLINTAVYRRAFQLYLRQESGPSPPAAKYKHTSSQGNFRGPPTEAMVGQAEKGLSSESDSDISSMKAQAEKGPPTQFDDDSSESNGDILPYKVSSELTPLFTKAQEEEATLIQVTPQLGDTKESQPSGPIEQRDNPRNPWLSTESETLLRFHGTSLDQRRNPPVARRGFSRHGATREGKPRQVTSLPLYNYSSERSFGRALYNGDTAQLEGFLPSFPDLNKSYSLEDESLDNLKLFGLTPLVFVCQCTHMNSETQTSVVEWLLQHGASPNCHDYVSELPPIQIPTLPKETSVAACLLEHRDYFNARLYEEKAALHLATYRGSPEIVKLLLKHGADPNIEDNEGRTALHLATSYGSLEMVKLLLKNGASTMSKDYKDLTPASLGVGDTNWFGKPIDISTKLQIQTLLAAHEELERHALCTEDGKASSLYQTTWI